MSDVPPPAEPDGLDPGAVIDATGPLLRVPVAPEWRDGVGLHLSVLTRAARLLEAFPLPDELEPAPVFSA